MIWDYPLVFLLEERSAEEMLKVMVPKIFPRPFHCIPFSGKQDLKKQLTRKMQRWQNEQTVFIVLCDSDRDDCKKLKNELAELCQKSGKPNYYIRLACRELESFYLGDLQAVSRAFEKYDIIRYKNKSEFRNPDKINNPSEKIQNITKGEYSKVKGSRLIAQNLNLDPANNTSSSFNILVKTIREIAKKL
jgi:hypothetical protein